MRTRNHPLQSRVLKVACMASITFVCCVSASVPRASAAGSSSKNAFSNSSTQAIKNSVEPFNPAFPNATSWPGDTFLAPVSSQTLPSQSFFKSGSASLTSMAIRILRREVTLIQTLDPVARLRITGHTDSVGPAQYNFTLSLERARAVMKWLKAHGLNKNIMEAIGDGFNHPVIQDRDASGNLIQSAAQANRRVVIELLS